MSSFIPPTTFADGDNCTAAQFMNEFTAMVPAAGLITDRAALASAADDDLILIYDTSTGTLSYITRANFVSTASTNSIKQTVSQTSHGFSVGQVLYPSSTAGVYALASATTAALSDGTLGVVDAVVDSNNFTLVTQGLVPGLSSLTAGTVYYLSDVTAGSVTSVASTTAIRIYTAISTTAAVVNINKIGASSGSSLQASNDTRLSLSSTNLLLSAYNGNQLFINGTTRTVSSTGYPLTVAGLAADTNYNIYAYWTGSTIALTASTTARATDATYGHQICSGDASKVLVGKARVNSSTAFASSQNQRFVISWKNRLFSPAYYPLLVNTNTSSTTYATISGTPVEFITWGDEAFLAGACGSVFGNASIDMLSSLSLNGVVQEVYSDSKSTTALVTQLLPMTIAVPVAPNEGYNYLNLVGQVSNSQGTWVGSTAAGTRTNVFINIKI